MAQMLKSRQSRGLNWGPCGWKAEILPNAITTLLLTIVYKNQSKSLLAKQLYANRDGQPFKSGKKKKLNTFSNCTAGNISLTRFTVRVKYIKFDFFSLKYKHHCTISFV